MAETGPTPVGQPSRLQVMSPNSAASDGQMVGETHGPDCWPRWWGPTALLNGGAMDGPLFGRTEPIKGLGWVQRLRRLKPCTP